MSFRPLVECIDRTNHDVVTARNGGSGAICVELGRAVSHALHVTAGNKLKVEYGEGEDHGKLRLTPISATSRETSYLELFATRGRTIAFNIRAAFLPDVAPPRQPVALPHSYARASLLIDYTPLRSKQHDATPYRPS